MPSTPSTIRLAFVAALAALALGACSGGGGKPTTTAGTMTPAPGAPTEGDPSDFFPVREGQTATRSGLTAGTNLQSLVSEEKAASNFPQFSVFQFGAAENANGIPLQRDTKTEAGRYAAIAYQAVLDHSMFLFQAGVYNQGEEGEGRSSFFLPDASVWTGNPTTGNKVAGTWKGKAIGSEYTAARRTPNPVISLASVEPSIIQADVEIGVTLEGDDQNVTWAFKNWDGGSLDFPDVSSEGVSLMGEEEIANQVREGSTEEQRAIIRALHTSDDHYQVFHKGESGPIDESSTWTSLYTYLQFYGPARQEAGGFFHFEYQGERHILRGVFAAKKQP